MEESKGYGKLKFLSALEVDISDDFPLKIIHHLSVFNPELSNFFPDLISCVYITDHFSVHPSDLNVGTAEQEKLIIIQEDQTAKIKRKTVLQ